MRKGGKSCLNVHLINLIRIIIDWISIVTNPSASTRSAGEHHASLGVRCAALTAVALQECRKEAAGHERRGAVRALSPDGGPRRRAAARVSATASPAASGWC